MPFSLDPSKLHMGDIILTRNKKGPISWLIRLFTISFFSHAALYVGNNSYMEAIGCGVHAQNILRLTFRRKSDVIVLRYPGIKQQEIRKIVDFVRYHYGMAYGFFDAVKAGLYAILGMKCFFEMKENKTFCSQLVASAYREIDMSSFNGRKALFTRPKDFYKEKKFERVDDIYREITDDEVKMARKKGLIDLQDKIVSLMMSKIWKILKKEKVFIRGISEIEDGICQIKDVKRRRVIDNLIVQVIRESGYLNMWEYDQKKCPENYSLMELKKKYPKLRELAAAASDKVQMWMDIANRHQHNFMVTKVKYEQEHLETTKVLLDMEELLFFNALKSGKEFDDFLRNLWNQGITPEVLETMQE